MGKDKKGKQEAKVSKITALKATKNKFKKKRSISERSTSELHEISCESTVPLGQEDQRTVDRIRKVASKQKLKKRKFKDGKSSLNRNDADEDGTGCAEKCKHRNVSKECDDFMEPKKKNTKKRHKIKEGKITKRVFNGDQNVPDDVNTLEGHLTAEAMELSNVDEDCSTGMKKWLMEYEQRRPGLEVLQQQIDDFIATYEKQKEQERKEREMLATEEGWTVVTHQKGRKKTTDSVTGTAVGSVSQAAVMEQMARKKHKEVEMDFYRFQKKEAQMNEIMKLQNKFEQDRKRIQEMRAARKFRPY